MRNYRLLLLLPLLSVLSGCPVLQPQDTPVPADHTRDAKTHRGYWIYVPSHYTASRGWPLVMTLHGTYGFDSHKDQIDEWKALAEQKGFIVVAPYLQSVQGILPTFQKLRESDLAADEAAVLAILDEVCAKYNIATLPAASTAAGSKTTASAASAGKKAILLTGFSAGGYPMYYIGLRNPERFSMLVARSCNSDIQLFEKIPLTPQARKLPIVIIWGRDDNAVVGYSWQAVEWLSNHDFENLKHMKVPGGHLRRPELAYTYWHKILPRELWAGEDQ